MKKLLITGFDPFDGEKINPSWEAVQRLPETIGSWQLTRLQVPTVYGLAAGRAWEAVQQLQPDAVLCVGQAGGREAVTPEMVAINLRYARAADNAGCAPQDEPVVPGGPAAWFSTLPVRAMAEAITQAGLPGQVSYSAGTFVCNDLLYTMLHRLNGSQTRAAFIHVPFLPEQAAAAAGRLGRPIPSLPLEEIVRALEAAIGAMQ